MATFILTKMVFRPHAPVVRMLSSARWASTSTLPLIVKPTAHELAAGMLGERNLEEAVRSIHEDGLVVVSDIVPHEHLDYLNTRIVQDARALEARGKDMPFNYNVGNIQQDPPPTKDYFEKFIFLNTIATQITTGVLGPKPKWTFCSGKSAMPPTLGAQPLQQPVHADADFAHPSHPFALVINVPLITFTPQNSSTEIWLGTHTGNLAGLQVQDGAHGDRASGRIKESLLEKRRQIRGPSQPVIEKGSIVIRDLRLWHAGMPSTTNDVRVMLAMIHFAPWFRNPKKLELAHDLKSTIEQQDSLQIPVDWVSTEAAKDRYMDRGFVNSYNLSQVA